jgi:hypothetical protein
MELIARIITHTIMILCNAKDWDSAPQYLFRIALVRP